MEISEYRAEFAAYNSSVEIARFKHHTGVEPELNIRGISERYSHLFTKQAIAELQSRLDGTPVDLETERKGLQSLLSAARLSYLGLRAKELTEELARCESAACVEWDGEDIALHSIPARLAKEAKKTRRRELAARWADAISACDDLLAERFEALRDSARALGFGSYRDLLAEISSTDFSQVQQMTESFLKRTQSVYTTALARAMALDLPDVRFTDLQFADYFHFEKLPALDRFFPARNLLETYAETMSGLGIRIENQPNLYIDAEPRPSKNPSTAWFRVNPPDDVRLVASPADGVSNYVAFFHAAGCAQHHAWCSRDLARRHPELIYSADSATTEGYGILFSNLLIDVKWLVDFVPGIAESQARKIACDLALLVVCRIRSLCAKLTYEILLHDAPDIRLEQVQSAYAELHEQATSFRVSPKLYLTDVVDGFQSACLLRALAFAVGLTEYLCCRYGRRWWTSRKAGDELRDLWNTASRYSAEELARLIGFGEISFDQLAGTLIAAMKGI